MSVRAAFGFLTTASVVACSGAPPTSIEEDGLVFEPLPAEITEADDATSLRVGLLVHNAESTPWRIVWGGCHAGLQVRLFIDEEMSGVPAWDSNPGQFMVCTLQGGELTIPPRASERLQLLIPLERIRSYAKLDGQVMVAVAPDLVAPLLQGPYLTAGWVTLPNHLRDVP